MAPLQRVQALDPVWFHLLGLQRLDLQSQADRTGILLGYVLGGAPSGGEPPGVVGRRAHRTRRAGLEAFGTTSKAREVRREADPDPSREEKLERIRWR